MTRIWEHAPYKESTLLVLLALADYADDHGICWPDIPSLAAKARISDRRAIDIIKALEEDGAILFERGGGRGKRSRYAILVGLTDEQKERVKLFHRNYFSEIKTVKPAVIKGELQRKKRVNYSVNLHPDSAQQSAVNPDPIHQHDPSMNPPPPTGADQTPKNDGDGGDEIELLLDEYNIGAAAEIAQLYRQKHPLLDLETIRQSIENLIADNVPKGTIVNRLRSRPPAPGKPYQRSRAMSRASPPLVATRANIPADVLTPAQIAERAKAKRADHDLSRTPAEH
jgi:hypothetical protein